MNFIEFCNRNHLIVKESLNELNIKNIHFTVKDFYESTGQFHFTINRKGQDISASIMIPFTLFLPNFMLDRLSLIDPENRETILSFFSIFIIKLIFLNYKNFYTIRDAEYFKPIQFFKDSTKHLYNKKNVEYFFSLFFKNKVSFVENAPRFIKNANPFLLGRNAIYSNLSKVIPIGRRVIARFENVHIVLKITKEEEESFLLFLAQIGKKDLRFLKMSRPFIYAIFSLSKGRFSQVYTMTELD